MAGLAWWVQTQWIDRQRRAWREHDAKLADAWRDDAGDDAAVAVDGAAVHSSSRTAVDNVIILPEAGASVAAHGS